MNYDLSMKSSEKNELLNRILLNWANILTSFNKIFIHNILLHLPGKYLFILFLLKVSGCKWGGKISI